jgi:hypothetical protein
MPHIHSLCSFIPSKVLVVSSDANDPAFLPPLLVRSTSPAADCTSAASLSPS